MKNKLFVDDAINNINENEKKTIKILVIIGDTGTTTKKIKNHDGSVSYRGFPWDLWKKIEEKIRHKYNFIYFNSDDLELGSTNYDMFCELVNKGKYDICLGTFYQTDFRQKLINYTTPINIDYLAVIHYPQASTFESFKKIIYPVSKLVGILVFIGIIFGIILSLIDKKRKNHKKGENYLLRVIFTTIASMFGEMGFLNENSSMTFRAMITVLIIMVVAFILVTFTQSEILKKLLSDSAKKINLINISDKNLISFKGYAPAIKLKKKLELLDLYNNNLKLYDFKWEETEKNDTNKLLNIYIKNTDKYDGVVLSYCRSIPLLKKYPKLINSNFGNELVSYVINFKNTEFLRDVDTSIMTLKNNLELKRICNSYYKTKEYSPVCSLT